MEFFQGSRWNCLGMDIRINPSEYHKNILHTFGAGVRTDFKFFKDEKPCWDITHILE